MQPLNHLKKYFALTALAIATLPLASAPANAHTHVSIGFGFGGCGYYRPCYHGYPYYAPYYGYPYYGYSPYYSDAPVVYAAPAPVVYGDAPAPVYTTPQPYAAPVTESTPAPAPAPIQTVTTTTAGAPFGYFVQTGIIKSPWSDFTLPKGDHKSGETLFDSNNGKPFRVP